MDRWVIVAFAAAALVAASSASVANRGDGSALADLQLLCGRVSS
jgi:hypothetical protein